MRYVLVTILLLVTPLHGDDSRPERAETKAAWEWTLDERLAVRFNPTLAMQRANKLSAAVRSVEVSTGVADLLDVVDGNETPELFAPGELFNVLLNGYRGDKAFRDISRSLLRERIQQFGLDHEQFWTDLEVITSNYLTIAARRETLLAKVAEASPREQRRLVRGLQDMDRELCAARAEALADARHYFGADTFNRFLYTVVAPGLRIGSDTTAEATPGHVRFLEGGCK